MPIATFERGGSKLVPAKSAAAPPEPLSAIGPSGVDSLKAKAYPFQVEARKHVTDKEAEYRMAIIVAHMA